MRRGGGDGLAAEWPFRFAVLCSGYVSEARQIAEVATLLAAPVRPLTLTLTLILALTLTLTLTLTLALTPRQVRLPSLHVFGTSDRQLRDAAPCAAL